MRFWSALLLGLPLVLVACAAPVEVGDERGRTESAILKAKKGERYTTTALLNLRDEASSDSEILAVLPLGSIITVTSSTATNGFYKVDTDEGKGWIFGSYLSVSAQLVDDDTADEDL